MTVPVFGRGCLHGRAECIFARVSDRSQSIVIGDIAYDLRDIQETVLILMLLVYAAHQGSSGR